MAVLTAFAVNGGLFGSWVSRIPDVAENLGLSIGRTSVAVLALATGAFIAMPIAGRIRVTANARHVTVVGGLMGSVAILAVAFSGNLAFLLGSLFLLGLSNGILDVAMNTCAVAVERAYGRPIMPSFHAAFSLGGMAGAAGGVAAAGTAVAVHFSVVSAVTVALILLAAGSLMSPAPVEGDRTPVRLDRELVVLGLMAFAVLMTEGAITDWSTLYLDDELLYSDRMVPLGFAAFSLCMALGRMGGDTATRMVGAAPLVRGCGILTAASLLVALTATHPVAVIAGFGVAGLGLSVTFPLLITAAANREPDHPGPAVATMATFGYTGFLAGPVIIGAAASATSIGTALLGTVVIMALVAAFAGHLGNRAESAPDCFRLRVDRLTGFCGAVRYRTAVRTTGDRG